MKSKSLTFICCVVLALLLCGEAKAATVIYSGSVASEVEDLVVDGVTYDVTFAANSASAGVTIFNGNSAAAQTAVSELDAALNATPAAFVSEAGVGSINQFIVEDNGSGNGIETTSFFAAENWKNEGSVSDDGSEAVFAEVAVTPLPAALPLFASGFGAMSLLGWRRRRKAQAAVA